MNTATGGSRQQQQASGTAHRAKGLHGHPLEGNTVRTAAAEALRTFVLVLAITSTAVAATLAKPLAGAPYGSLAVPVAGGLALAVLAASLGHLSGAHLNPAVTVGLAVNRRFPWAYTPAYVLAQFAGAIGAAAVTWGLYGKQARAQANLGATYPAAGVGLGRVFAAELIVTFVLVLVITSVASDSRIPRGVAALAIGAARIFGRGYFGSAQRRSPRCATRPCYATSQPQSVTFTSARTDPPHDPSGQNTKTTLVPARSTARPPFWCRSMSELGAKYPQSGVPSANEPPTGDQKAQPPLPAIRP
jgi:glycerol uptake facilitator-like aquaporin